MGMYAARDVQVDDIVQSGECVGAVVEEPFEHDHARMGALAEIVYVCSTCHVRHTISVRPWELVVVAWREPKPAVA